MKVAVAVFCYNRPRHLSLMLHHLSISLKEYGDVDVILFQDAPVGAKTSQWVETSEIARRFDRATYASRKQNLGFHNIISGVTELLECYDGVIVFEDDIVPDRNAIGYFLAALRYYQSESRVYSVCGAQFARSSLQAFESEFFLARFFIPWGWATWKRAWESFDAVRPTRVLGTGEVEEFNLGNGTYFSDLLVQAIKPEECLWDILWYHHIFEHGGYSLFPRRSLVFNTGEFSGVHRAKVIRERGGLMRRLFAYTGLSSMLAARPSYSSRTLTYGNITSLASCGRRETQYEFPEFSTSTQSHREFVMALAAMCSSRSST